MRARLIVGAIVLLASARAAAEPAPIADEYPTLIQTAEPRLLCKPPTPTETCRPLPPGRFLDEQSWQRIDAEQHALQDARTRLTAENDSLRKTAQEWQPGWKTVTGVFLSGLAVGLYLTR